MSKPVMTDNERAARLAGWEKGCGCSDPEWCGRRGLWHRKGFSGHNQPPDYENSIDAQMRDLDPLVEARYGLFDEERHSSWSPPHTTVRLLMTRERSFSGSGDSWKQARLKALLAALEAQS